MDNNTDSCAGCDQKEQCGQVFKKLGNTEGPNVTRPVILAFLVPILVFIATLAGANKLLQDRIEGKTLIAVTFAAALATTLIAVIIIRAFRRSLNKTL